jgi:hypothetical protein
MWGSVEETGSAEGPQEPGPFLGGAPVTGYHGCHLCSHTGPFVMKAHTCLNALKTLIMFEQECPAL